jgi:Zn-dependent protease with chaperone function
MKGLASLALALALMPALIAAKPAPVTADMLTSLAQMELRVRTIIGRIAIANVTQCAKQAPYAGMLIRVNYGTFAPALRTAQIGAFGTGKYPKVSLLVPGGPADMAELRNGDEIVSFNNDPVPVGLSEESDAQKWSSAVKALGEAWDKETKTSPTKITILREGSERTLALSSTMACELIGSVTLSKDMNASNAGARVWVTTGLLENTPDDNEVAFVIAHEAAHSILGHAVPENEKQLKNPAFRRPAEVEADYLGVQLMANAGYDPYAAARYHARWSKMGRGFFQKLTGGFNGPYLAPKDRIAFLQKRAEEVDPQHRLAAP